MSDREGTADSDRREQLRDPAGLVDSAAKTLERIRTNRRAHAAALGVAVLAGLAGASVHWIGLVVGGALVGLSAPTLPRAIGYGLGFGVAVLVVFAVTLAGSIKPILAMRPIVFLAAASGLGLPLFGSLARGLI